MLLTPPRKAELIFYSIKRYRTMKQPIYLSPRCEAIDLGLRESVMTTASNEDYTVTPQNPFGAPVFGDEIFGLL